MEERLKRSKSDKVEGAVRDANLDKLKHLNLKMKTLQTELGQFATCGTTM